MVAVSAAAIALSGVLSVVAAQAFKGHQADAATPRSSAPRHVNVPAPDRVPAIAGEATPLQPPAQPPASATPDPVPSAPAPQVSGGS